MNDLHRIVGALDEELNIGAFEDASHNGLQVENRGRVRKICVGVDASMAFFEAAAERGADLLVCHHGLSWGDSLKRITGMNYRRLRFLIEHDMALYGSHLPLDAHPRLGNNAQIVRALGLDAIEPFGSYHGIPIGFRGELPEPLPVEEFKRRVAGLFGSLTGSMDFGKESVHTVAVVSGGAADEAEQAAEAGIDVYITGEPKLTAWHLAQEREIHILFAGHYATETFGVRAVGDWLAERFGIEAEFIDLKIPY